MSSSKPGSSRTDALALAVRYTRARVRSAHEVLAYLHRRGIPPRTARRAVESAQALGAVDDRACARLWAGQWARQGYAAAAIRQKLLTKGLEARVADAAVAMLDAAEEDRRRAQLLIDARLRRGQAPRGRLARWLAARGFDADIIEQTLANSHEEQ